MSPTQAAAFRRRVMHQSLVRQWNNIPMANAVLRNRRAAGLLGLGATSEEETLAARQRELAEIRAERKAIEAETAMLKARLRGEPVAELAPQETSLLEGVNWTYAMIGAGVLGVLIWKRRKR